MRRCETPSRLFPGRIQTRDDPGRVTSTVQDRVNVDRTAIDQVVDCERETFGQHPMKAFGHRVTSRVKPQRLYVGVDTVKEVIAESGCVPFVELPALTCKSSFAASSIRISTHFLSQVCDGRVPVEEFQLPCVSTPPTFIQDIFVPIRRWKITRPF